MIYRLADGFILRRLEFPAVYCTRSDELYELDEDGFARLMQCSTPEGAEIAEGEFLDFCLAEGILGTDSRHDPIPKAGQSPTPSLRYLELQITNRCNLACRHCYIGTSGHDELSIGDLRRILDEFEAMQGLRVLISGGEPLLHRDFDGLNSILPDYSLRKVLFTNGVRLDDILISRLNVDEIQISVDGMGPAHEALRGQGSYEPAIRALRAAIDHGIQASVSTMVHAGNLDDFDLMQELFLSIGIRDWTVDVPCEEGRLKDNPRFRLAPETAGKYMRYGFGEGLHGGGAGYACGLHLMSVMADGRCAKCAFYVDSPLGTIEEGLAVNWARLMPIPLDALSCDCKHISACRGGCRYRAKTLGDPMGKDLYRCYLYDIIYK